MAPSPQQSTATTDTADTFLSEEERMVRDAARRVAREVVAKTAAERDRRQQWPRDELKALADIGFMGMLAPEAWGGGGLSFLQYCLAIEEISAADCGVGTIVHVHNTTLKMLCDFGTDAQKRRYLPDAVRGARIGASLLTEPQAGSDTAAFRTSARREGDAWVLEGTKQFISNGSEAGVAVVIAVTDPTAGKHGFTFFLLDPADPGYRVLRVEDKLGQQTAHTAQIQLDRMRLDDDAVLGEVGGGYRLVMSALSDGRIAIAAQAVGVARAALDAAVRYANEREAYGAPIIRLQAVAFKLAEMATRVEAASLLYRNAARLVMAGRPCAKEAAMAKLFASEIAERVCSDALQVHGGYGYLRDFPVERYCRDVRVCKIYEGTSDIQKLIISRNL
ncbi:acyl-CoA dehydrogenase family protein [Quisquiliibacterium transsilvanicum]|uniref:3-sulfinopropanoyl-CoA desulfinase n=1 Tax=Quisquiliibacterium transsilvanicum TaxID=1549638 RepID=A0A7W8M897_9BURK|nr:acyl-CoA dehydrogenase family protein [Quisquiliibacterium transsilvanicum]MBB5271588.1 alkylation response protein AidB-like acyl-CoA dehydrogenase [Quisquiliibacterium transsilvanicum]